MNHEAPKRPLSEIIATYEPSKTAILTAAGLLSAVEILIGTYAFVSVANDTRTLHETLIVGAGAVALAMAFTIIAVIIAAAPLILAVIYIRDARNAANQSAD